MVSNTHKKSIILMKKVASRYAVIMAGGTGTRLWPLSRKARPKQFHALISSKTLLGETFDRVSKIIPKKNIYISTTKQYQSIVLKTLPTVIQDRLIIEPAPRGTAPAITLVAQTIFQKDPDAVVVTLPSDHAISENEVFIKSLQIAFDAVDCYPDKIATIGINPTFPSTEFGYIHMGDELATIQKKRIFFVDSFEEKPNLQTAKEYLADWAYLWNAGYFIFSAKTFLKEARALMPEISQGINQYCNAKDSPKEKDILYEKLPNDALDLALIEKLPAEKRMVVPSEMGWDDIGTWDALFEFLKKTHKSDFIAKGNHIDSGSKNCFVYGGEKLIATLGLKDVVIVETEDALLVAHKNSAKEVKKTIEKLKRQGKYLYL